MAAVQSDVCMLLNFILLFFVLVCNSCTKTVKKNQASEYCFTCGTLRVLLSLTSPCTTTTSRPSKGLGPYDDEELWHDPPPYSYSLFSKSFFQKMCRSFALYYQAENCVHYEIWAYIVIPRNIVFAKGHHRKSERISIKF